MGCYPHSGSVAGLINVRNIVDGPTNDKLNKINYSIQLLRVFTMTLSRKRNSEMQLSIQNKKLQQDLKACQFQYATLKKQSEKTAKLVLLQQEEDRKEISRRLHDEIAQILTGVNFQLSILGRTTSHSTEGLRTKIIDAQLLVEKAVDQINHFARSLHPMILDDL